MSRNQRPADQETRGPGDQRTRGPGDQRTRGPDNEGTRGPGAQSRVCGTKGPRDQGASTNSRAQAEPTLGKKKPGTHLPQFCQATKRPNPVQHPACSSASQVEAIDSRSQPHITEEHSTNEWCGNAMPPYTAATAGKDRLARQT